MTFALSAAVALLRQPIIVGEEPPGPAGPQQPPLTGSIYRWHRAEIANVVTSSGAVDTWIDLSGHGNDMTGVTTGRPLWIESTSSFNGQSCVAFDGINDHLDDTHAALTGSGLTFGIIFKKITQGQNLVDGILSFRAAAGSDFNGSDRFNYNTGRKNPASTDDEIEWSGHSPGVAISNVAQTETEHMVFRIQGGSIDVIKQVVGGAVVHHSSQSYGDHNITRTEIGARNGNSQQFRGDYLELIVYQTALTDDEMMGLDNYLSSSLAGTLSGSA